jgi:hypothetical protein
VLIKSSVFLEKTAPSLNIKKRGDFLSFRLKTRQAQPFEIITEEKLRVFY